MSDSEKQVPLEEAVDQVRIVGARLAMMHMAYARLLIDELGPEKGKDMVVKAMIKYGKLVSAGSRAGRRDLPFYGVHEKLLYGDKTYIDSRDQPSEGFDFSLFKVVGCILAKTFLEHGERELGALYCYIDAAKSMGLDPAAKLIHTACEVCGDGFCAFDFVPTTEKERADFEENNPQWKDVDPILLMK